MTSTLIKKIDKLKGFGSFEDFSWPTQLPEFKKYNLLYGKNGSGKTTLSHFFQCYEDGKFPNYFSPTIEVTTESGKTSDLNALFKRIKVFNSYYVTKNFSWDVDTPQASNLLWLGNANIEIQSAIEKLDREIDQLAIDVPQLEQERSKCDSGYSEFLTNHSRTIRDVLGYNQSKYTKIQLEQDYKDIIEERINPTSLGEEYSAKQKIANATLNEFVVDQFSPLGLNLEEVSNEVCRLISEEITPTTKIEELMKNPALHKWVKDGLIHHSAAGECKFCKQPNLTEHRLKDLKGFFDDAQEQFLSKLQTKISHLNHLVSGLGDTSLERIKIFEGLIDENEEVILSYKKQCDAIKRSVQVLVSSLESKMNDLYSNFESKCSEIQSVEWKNLEDSYLAKAHKINEIRTKHNQYVKNFENDKKKAQRDVILHLALQQKDEYVRLSNGKTESVKKHTFSSLELSKKMSDRDCLKAKISGSDKAAESITNLIKQMGHAHIKLEYDDVKMPYHLKRGGAAAKRLSEGEKTAIAFAHFLASLNEKSFNKTESIVVIDDPISSLDANACYFIYGLIHSLKEEVNQLFLMTHSHLFFVLLMKHFDDKKGNHSCYEIHRITKPDSEVGHSQIVEMEKVKRKYYNEYHYLFFQIYRAAIALKGDPSSIDFDRLYSLMNYSRKLLEAFLTFKYPQKTELSDKFKEAVSHKNVSQALKDAIFKVVNFGSHSGIDGLIPASGIDSSIAMADSVSLVLDFIKEVDEVHYNGMLQCEIANSSN